MLLKSLYTVRQWRGLGESVCRAAACARKICRADPKKYGSVSIQHWLRPPAPRIRFSIFI